ncbi:hypothetical protein V5E97_06670 [Singulisphaera sp. Ch08]|uniref:Uncharacterized protein n=1 Tax=Singulisphaera sp. Ch08 TaxID=3120278 RepID=A0AAU7CM16_9BACT
MAEFSTDSCRNFSNPRKDQDIMGKKRELKPTWRNEKSRYFPVPLNVQTCEPIKVMLEQLVLDFQTKTSINFLDMRKISQQAICNIALLHLKHLLETKGAKHLQKELAPVIRQMELIVAEDMKSRGRELEPEYLPLPEGVSSPAEKSKGKGGNTTE